MSLKLQRTTLSEQVSQRLQAYIGEEGLGPGDTLPTEMELVERFGVSRTVIREGLSSLIALGVISSQGGRRLRVSKLKGSSLNSFFATALRLDGEAITDLLELRKVLEQFGAGRAAKQVSPEAIDQLEVDYRAIATTLAARDYEAFAEADFAFHTHIAAMSGNTILTHLVEALREALLSSILYGMSARRSPEDLERVRRVHQDVLETIRAGDAGAAQAAMARHFDDALSSILESETRPR